MIPSFKWCWVNYNLCYLKMECLETPDGIDEIKNAMVTMQVWVSPTVSFDLLVNGTACNNPPDY